jgi:hypothetical protein
MLRPHQPNSFFVSTPMAFLLVPLLPQSKLKTAGISGPLLSTRSGLQRKTSQKWERWLGEAEFLEIGCGKFTRQSRSLLFLLSSDALVAVLSFPYPCNKRTTNEEEGQRDSEVPLC